MSERARSGDYGGRACSISIDMLNCHATLAVCGQVLTEWILDSSVLVLLSSHAVGICEPVRIRDPFRSSALCNCKDSLWLIDSEQLAHHPPPPFTQGRFADCPRISATLRQSSARCISICCSGTAEFHRCSDGRREQSDFALRHRREPFRRLHAREVGVAQREVSERRQPAEFSLHVEESAAPPGAEIYADRRKEAQRNLFLFHLRASLWLWRQRMVWYSCVRQLQHNKHLDALWHKTITRSSWMSSRAQTCSQ
jgi:hypothetical protein